MRKPLLLTLILPLFLAFSVRASERDDLDAFIRGVLAKFPETPGLSVAVVKDGRTILTAGYGYADLATKRPMTAATPVYIGSTTKAYTGLLLAILAQRKVLDLDAPIVKYLPELDAWPEGHRVTLRALLSHSSGIENDGITTRTAYTGEHASAQLLALLPASKKLESTAFRYDNLGYVVGALIAERVTGTKWQDLLAQSVFQPLGMNHTSAYMSATKAWGGLATGYQTSFPELVNQPSILPKNDRTMHAAGGIVTNANDLARWLEANLRDGRLGRKQAVPASAVQETHKQQVTFPDKTFYKYRQYAYGFGWFWGEYDGELLMHHLGGYDGWRAHISYMPRKNIGVAVVTNNNGLGSELTTLVATYVHDYLLNKPGFDRAYTERIAELRKSITERAARVQTALDQRAKRTWMLAKPLDVYAGRYTSAEYGVLVIRLEGEKLVASLGQLHAPLEAFTKPETARVELIPGTGDVLNFTFPEGGGKPSAVSWGDAPFTRIGD